MKNLYRSVSIKNQIQKRHPYLLPYEKVDPAIKKLIGRFQVNFLKCFFISLVTTR